MMTQQRRITKAYFDIALLKYTPLIGKLSFLIGVDRTHTEELRTQGINELIRCMICYDSRGSFITFLYGRLENIFRHMRDVENRARRPHIMSQDYMANIVGPDSDSDTHIVVQECLSCLNSDEYNVITELFFGGRTMRDIATDLNTVHSTVCRIKDRAINKMRQKCQVIGE